MNLLLPNNRRLLRLTTGIVGAALCGLVLVGYVHLAYRPLNAMEASQRERIEALRQLLSENANVHSAHRKLTAEVAELESQIAAVRRRIPNEPLEADFLRLATAIAEEEDLQIDNFRRHSIEAFLDYSEVRVAISGTGSFAGICRFLNRVNQLERLSTVRSMSLANAEDAEGYPFEVIYALQFGMQTASDTPEGGVL